MSTRTVVRVAVVIGVLAAFESVLFEIGEVVRLLLVAGFLAVALNPAVNALERRGLGRGIATIIVFLITVVVLIAFLAAGISPLYREIRDFVDQAPQYVEDVRQSELFSELDSRYHIFERAQADAGKLGERLPATAGALLGFAGTVFRAVFQTVTVLFVTLFLLLEMPRITESVRSLLYPSSRRRVDRISAEINRTVAGYVAGNLLISLIAGTVVFVTMVVLDVPYPLVLALVMALFDLIPLIGATLGAVIIVLVTLTQGIVPAAIAIAVLVVYQQLENHVLQPVVMKRSVAVSPFVVIVSVLIGSALLGVLGALLAIPVAGSVQIVLRDFLDERRRRVAEAEAQTAPSG